MSSLCLILWNDGSDICTGRYLATKWRYEKTRLFHCLAVMLLVLVVAGFLVTAIVSGATLKSQTHLGTGVAKSVPNFAFSWFNIRFGLLSVLWISYISWDLTGGLVGFDGDSNIF